VAETGAKVLKKAKEAGVKFVSLRFVDVLGTAKNCEVTVDRLEKVIDQGLWFDGSSIEGFARIHESDMLLKPDLSTFATLPWTNNTVAAVMCDVYGSDGKPFVGDPRFVLKSVVEKARKMGFEYKVGPELEFFLFCQKNGNGNGSGTGGHASPEPHDSASYFDLDPMDLAADLKREIVPMMESMGMSIEMSHHEVAPGQHEIDFKYDTAVKQADNVLTYKNTVKMVAKKYGLFASFMPKPIQGINGSGMHVHQSLWKGGKNAFFDAKDEYNLSDVAYSFVAGQLHHARALSAVVAPTVNSYKRLVPGYEAPVYVCWGRRNRSALIRVPEQFMKREYATRAELRCPDPSCNPYLAFAAMLAAGLDGIERKMKPPESVEEDVYEFDDAKLAKRYINTLPGSLGEAMAEFAKDAVLKEALGANLSEKLAAAQKQQWDAYRQQVTKWELDEYYPVL